MIVCVIPARGGSKRVPKKNIKLFNGKPMIAWSIDAAIQANIFDKIIVSTDDDEIANFSKSLGVDVPFIRPKNLSDDYASTADVMAHACQWIKNKEKSISIVCCLYATAPFIKSEDLKKALQIIQDGNWRYVFSAAEYPSSIYRSFFKDNNGGVKMLFPDMFNKRTQDLPTSYHDAGMFYMGTNKSWEEKIKTFETHSFPLIIPSYRVQDIDTVEDWERAEHMAQSILQK